jgi:hypothetical protein
MTSGTKEAFMATKKNAKGKSYCDAVNKELPAMKKRIEEMREELIRTYGAESDVVRAHETQLLELAESIDWKFHILAKDCRVELTNI